MQQHEANELKSRLGAIQSKQTQQRILEASRAAYRILYEDLPRLIQLEKDLKKATKQARAAIADAKKSLAQNKF